jgi:hypothetical protein
MEGHHPYCDCAECVAEYEKGQRKKERQERYLELLDVWEEDGDDAYLSYHLHTILEETPI